MAHDDDYDDDLDIEQDAPAADQEKTPGWRRRLENKAKTATERAEAAERKLAFHEAGIDPKTDKRLAFFIENYRGDTTPEAVKAAATEAGFIDAAEPQDEALPADEQSAHQRISAVATSGRPTGAYDFPAAIAEAKAAGQMQRVIELKQAEAAATRAEPR